jgi:hypothetical protein
LQTQSVGPGIVPRYSGPLDCLRTIIKEESFRGLFKGLTLFCPASWQLMEPPTQSID